MSMILATGAVEADNYLIGFVFVILGILSGVAAIFYQNKKESKNKQLYYNEED